MVARAPGATALYAGGMEIADDLETIVKRQPHHPFNRLGLGPVGLATELDVAISTIQLALAKEGLRFEGSWRSHGLYADIHGLARPANVVPESVARGELGGLAGKRVAVIGIAEVGDYDAEATALALKERHGVEAFPEEVSVGELPAAAAVTDLYGRRAPEVGRGATAIAYPPGFTNLPPEGFELLASPPSPHGWRLQQAIGLGAIAAEITSFESSGQRITAARAAHRVFHADSFVLATGRHIGGGLQADRETVEPLLGLGVFRDGVPAASLGTRLQHLKYLDPAEEMRLGLMTDKRLRPFDADGAVPFANLHAAGAVLGGYEYAGACGFGVPILTGWLAGRYAARQEE